MYTSSLSSNHNKSPEQLSSEIAPVQAQPEARPNYGVDDLSIQPNDNVGIKDLDKLRIQSYYDGLSAFIQYCVTPMTIAIQGPWGSGKTSALNCVKFDLQQPEKRVEVIYVNTWQFSVLGNEDSLVFSVITEIMHSFVNSRRYATPEDFQTISARAQKIIGQFGRGGKKLGKLALSVMLSRLSQGVDYTPLLSGEDDEDFHGDSGTLADLRNSFADLVQDYCDKTRKDRVVFLIDDLDRLQPSRALELLEVMKIVLDVPKTVFVLAIDYDIVQLGLSQKYGEARGKYDTWKARSFFDKIVQVPFNMPTNAYDPTALISDLLGKILGEETESLATFFKVAVQRSAGNNPRAIKRLFNAFTLTSLIYSSGANNEEFDSAGVFLFICYQLAYPEVYRSLSETMVLLEGSSFEDGLDSRVEKFFGLQDFEEEDLKSFGISPKDQSRLRLFVELMRSHFTLGEEEGDESLDWKRIKNAIGMSSVATIEPSGGVDSDSTPSVQNLTGRLAGQGLDPNNAPIIKLQNAMNERIRLNPDKYPESLCISVLGDELDTRYSCYFGDDVDKIMQLGARSRKRFLSLRQRKTFLNIGFGFWQDRDSGRNDDETVDPKESPLGYCLANLRADKDHWMPVLEEILSDDKVQLLHEDSEERQVGLTVDASEAPIQFKYIKADEDIDIFMKYFDIIYWAAYEEQP